MPSPFEGASVPTGEAEGSHNTKKPAAVTAVASFGWGEPRATDGNGVCAKSRDLPLGSPGGAARSVFDGNRWGFRRSDPVRLAMAPEPRLVNQWIIMKYRLNERS